MKIARLCAAVLLLAFAGWPAAAQLARPPVKILAGFPPGGNVDILARVFAESLGQALGRTVIVINKPGAGGQVAAETLREAAPDGDTLMLCPDATVIVRPLTMTKPPYDPIADFAPVVQTGQQDYAFALSTAIPPKSLAEFATWAKANPDGAHFGSAGEGGATHFLGVLIGQAIGVDLRQVPFNGSGPAVSAAAAGQITSTVQPLGTLVAQAQAGKIRIVAVSGAKRNPAYPDVPSFAELGYPKLTATNWFGIFAPSRTPKAVVARVNEIVTAAMRTPKVAERMHNLALDINVMTPAQFAAVVKDDVERWRPVIKSSGFKIEIH